MILFIPGEQMTTKKRSPKSPANAIQKLKKKNTELRKKLKFVERERDDYLRAAHAYVKSTITTEELENLFDEKELAEGVEGSLVEFFREAKKIQKESAGK